MSSGDDARWAALVDDAAAELRVAYREGADWRRLANEKILPRRLDETGTAEAFLRWARDHRVWCFTVAECEREICGKPREAAIYVLTAIVEELLEEETDEP